MSFWGELRRRNVVKVAVAYAIVGWLLLQVVDVVLPTFNAPPWVGQTITLVLILGFPIVFIIAWAFEITPDGIKKTNAIPLKESISHVTGRKLDFVVIMVLVLAVGFMFVDNYVLVDSDAEAVVQETATPAVEPASENPSSVIGLEASNVLPNSVAVLPCDNLSLDPENAFFALGIHEEMLNQLYKLRNLSLISRTTVLRYADSELSIPEIAQELNVESVLECSVRYADERVRITAQLIDGVTDEHLWSEVYEEDFAGIFEIQASVAMNIANALDAEFSDEEQERIEDRPTESTEAYALYLATIDHIRKSTPEGGVRCLETISRALALDPTFVLGWQTKAACHSNRSIYVGPTQEEQELAMQANLRALELDPEFAPAHAAIAYNLANTGQWQEAERKYQEALSFGLNQYEYDIGGIRYRTGRLAEARQLAIAAYQKDPLDSNAAFRVMDLYEMLGDRNDADRIYERGLALYDAWPSGHFHRLVALLGRGVRSEVREFDAQDFVFSSEIVQYADEPRAALARLRENYADDAFAGFGLQLEISAWAAYFGDHQLALDASKNATNTALTLMAFFWMPLYEDVRQLPGFKDYMREIGLVEYWQEFGWPDLCRPVGRDDFECS